MEINLQGVRLELMPQRGVYWPDQNALLVSDTHFGKESTFRRGGIPVPVGSTRATLDRIQAMMERCKPSRLIFLGDLFHNRSSLSGDVMDLLSQFFQKHAACELTLVIGNHDLHLFQSDLNPLPTSWNMNVVPQLAIGRVGLAHDPAEWPSKSKSGKTKPDSKESDSKESGAGREAVDLMLCGHVHPAIRARSLTDSAGKLPCFWFSRQRLVLPAIGTFTGTHPIDPRSGDRIWVIAGEKVIAFGKNAGTTNAIKVSG